MALINCSECNGQISDKAKVCPKCGVPVVIKETFKCFECGIELKKGTKVCSNCGGEQSLSEEIAVVARPIKDQENIPVQNSSSKPKKKNKLLVWSLIGGITLLLIILLGIHFITHGVGDEATRKIEDSLRQDSINSANKLVNTARNLADSLRQDSIDAAASNRNRINNNSSSNNNYAPTQGGKTSENLREELYQKESVDPASYLTVQYTWQVNLVANTILEGHVFNNATIAGFKNISIRAGFYSAAGDLLGQEDFTVLEFIPAGGSTYFKHKIIGWWKGAASSKYTLLSAEPY